MLKCSLITFSVLFALIRIEASFEISILNIVFLVFFIPLASFLIRDRLDYQFVSHKRIETISIEELYQLLPNIRADVIEISYNFIHKDKSMSAIEYAYKNNISIATLYRYINKVKREYESLDVKV